MGSMMGGEGDWLGLGLSRLQGSGIRVSASGAFGLGFQGFEFRAWAV